MRDGRSHRTPPQLSDPGQRRPPNSTTADKAVHGARPRLSLEVSVMVWRAPLLLALLMSVAVDPALASAFEAGHVARLRWTLPSPPLSGRTLERRTIGQ